MISTVRRLFFCFPEQRAAFHKVDHSEFEEKMVGWETGMGNCHPQSLSWLIPRTSEDQKPTGL